MTKSMKNLPNRQDSTNIKEFSEIQKEIRQKRINSILNCTDLNEKQLELIRKYDSYLQRKGLALESRRAYLQLSKLFMLDIKKDISELTLKDIDEYLAYIGNKYMEKTIVERKLFLIYFFEWYFGKKRDQIDLIKDLKPKKNNGTKLPEEILTPDEVKKLIQVADNFRDKAIVSLLYETASRKGEFLQLKIKHIEIVNREYGLISIPQGKTDSRKLPVIYSIQHLQNWLNSHPHRDNSNAPLFITLGAWLGRALGEDGIKRLLKILGQRAGIKKNIYPHLLRHSRLTQLAKELKESELRKFAGWTPASNMVKVYVHLSGEDVSNKILANAGLIDAEEVKKENGILRNIKCPRCSKINPADYKYCTCGFVLDIKEANKLILGNKNAEESLNNFIQIPEIQKLFKVVYKLQKEMKGLKG